MQLDIAVSKIDKFGVSPSGDSVEITERPTGGLSVVLSDGQGSGEAAKAISSFVVSKAISLIADGARDGAVARAVHDALYARRRAQVSATLTIISADTNHGQLLVSRNSNCPVLVLPGGEGEEQAPEQVVLDADSSPIGTQRMIKPHVEQFPLMIPRTVVAFSDGILSAGRGRGRRMKIGELTGLAEGLSRQPVSEISRKILGRAVERDQQRPADDISVVVLKISRRTEDRQIREMWVRYPL
ncbi:stage II sporulation protein E [bacterium BMS3Abin01]|nr:stage II sporulation protein E [bacterium BMS3Abin01]HDY69569.1 serine/threonine-protein phosphatase [Actinomycetota bacterium]